MPPVMKLKPGTLVVLEGIDAAGKSTQLEELGSVFPNDHFTHQPSGGTELGAEIYRMTENAPRMHPVTRQLLHLAAHTEHYDRQIVPWLSRDGVFLDRCWISTLAYGYYDGGLQHLIDLPLFLELVKLPTQGVDPTIVFLFLESYQEDPHNTEKLISAYYTIAVANWEFPVVLVPQGTKEWVTAFIWQELARRDLARADGT